MAYFETIFAWITIALYGISSALSIFSFVFRKERLFDRLHWLIGLAFVVHTASFIARYDAIGNLPVASDYETSTGGSWFIVLFTLYVMIRQRSFRAVCVATMPLALILLGYGVMKSAELAPMSASVKSFWLYIHVFFAWLAFGAYVIGFGLGVIYLLKEKYPEKGFSMKVPDLPRIDELMFRYLIFGFITDAVMIASGAIWAKDLWGNYWSWDPVEMWSLVTWLIYGLAIHLRLTMGWRGRRLAWIMIFALSGMIITYFGLNYLVESSLHVFDAWQDI